MKPANASARKSSDKWYRQVAGAALTAGAGVLATPQDANAQIVTYTPNVSTTGTTGQSNIFFDYLSGTTSTTTFAGAQFQVQRSNLGSAGNAAFFYALNANNHAIGNQNGAFFYPGKLAANAPIGPAGPWLVAAGVGYQTLAFPAYTAGNWLPLPSSTGYLGLRFGDGTNFNYGWAELSIDANANVTLSRFAYDTVPNEAINAGQVSPVPEPSAALLVMGAAGLAAYRARRGRKEEAVPASPVA